jgi:hypothetical protein
VLRLRHLPLLALAAAAPVARAGEIAVEWDKDLAFEWDRANYENMLQRIVESSRARATAWLGMALERPLSVKVHAPAEYERRFGSDAAWSRGAHYERGAIHVNGGARLDERFAALLAHEMTHAVLDDRGTGAMLPAWLNEGLAERLRWMTLGIDGLDTTQVQTLEVALDQRQLLPLPQHRSLSRFGYLQSYAAVLFLEKKLGKDVLLSLVARTLSGTPFDAALDRELRWTPRNIDEGFAYWVDHLQ